SPPGARPLACQHQTLDPFGEDISRNDAGTSPRFQNTRAPLFGPYRGLLSIAQRHRSLCRTPARSPIDSTAAPRSLCRTPAGSPIDSTEKTRALRTPEGSPIDSTQKTRALRTPEGSPIDSYREEPRPPDPGGVSYR